MNTYKNSDLIRLYKSTMQCMNTMYSREILLFIRNERRPVQYCSKREPTGQDNLFKLFSYISFSLTSHLISNLL